MGESARPIVIEAVNLQEQPNNKKQSYAIAILTTNVPTYIESEFKYYPVVMSKTEKSILVSIDEDMTTFRGTTYVTF
jgi:hypothetical protein